VCALCTIVAHNIAQNTPDNFPSYPLDNHHSSDDVYLREGGGPAATVSLVDWRTASLGNTTRSSHVTGHNCSSVTHGIGTVTDIPDQPYDLYIYR